MAKDIAYDTEARGALKKGVDKHVRGKENHSYRFSQWDG